MNIQNVMNMYRVPTMQFCLCIFCYICFSSTPRPNSTLSEDKIEKTDENQSNGAIDPKQDNDKSTTDSEHNLSTEETETARGISSTNETENEPESEKTETSTPVVQDPETGKKEDVQSKEVNEDVKLSSESDTTEKEKTVVQEENKSEDEDDNKSGASSVDNKEHKSGTSSVDNKEPSGFEKYDDEFESDEDEANKSEDLGENVEEKDEEKSEVNGFDKYDDEFESDEESTKNDTKIIPDNADTNGGEQKNDSPKENKSPTPNNAENNTNESDTLGLQSNSNTNDDKTIRKTYEEDKENRQNKSLEETTRAKHINRTKRKSAVLAKLNKRTQMKQLEEEKILIKKEKKPRVPEFSKQPERDKPFKPIKHKPRFPYENQSNIKEVMRPKQRQTAYEPLPFRIPTGIIDFEAESDDRGLVISTGEKSFFCHRAVVAMWSNTVR